MTTPDSGFVAVHNHGHVHLEDSMGNDLHIVNNARVSFDQESDEFTPKERGLLNFLMRERHGSPWEAVVFRFDVKAPIFVVREWQRHRMGCLAGDTEVSFVDTNGAAPKSLRKTMAELHRMWTEGERNGIATAEEKVAEINELLPLGLTDREVARRTGVSHPVVARVRRGTHPSMRDARWRVRRMRVRVLNEETNQFTVGHIADVIDSGAKQVFRVTTESGRSIELTADHKVYTDRGWKRLGELARIHGTDVDLPSDAYLMANGTIAHQDRVWLKEQREAGRSVQQIADDAGVSYHTIRKWLKIHDLKFIPDETRFSAGHTPWNAGYTGYSLPKGRLTDAGREKLRAARGGERSNFWRGGITNERALIGAWTRQQAARVHDRCHREIHQSVEEELGFASAVGKTDLPPLRERPRPRGQRLVAHADRILSVTYVGVKQTFDLSIEGPWHNFVANGLVVHNSFNEQSARYSQVPDHFYVPEREYCREQQGKPGSYFFSQIEDAAVVDSTIDLIDSTQRTAFDAYHQMLEQGVAKELARTVLPVGMFSRMKWTVNLRALFNFLQLRNHEHAQREIRDYAIAVEELAKQVVPVAFEVFEENGRVCP